MAVELTPCLNSLGSTEEDESDSSSEHIDMLDWTLSWTQEGVILGRGVVLRLKMIRHIQKFKFSLPLLIFWRYRQLFRNPL